MEVIAKNGIKVIHAIKRNGVIYPYSSLCCNGYCKGQECDFPNCAVFTNESIELGKTGQYDVIIIDLEI